MPERHTVTTIDPDPRDPKYTLALIFLRETPGAMIQPEPLQSKSPKPMLSLTVNPNSRDYVQRTWDSITDTPEFSLLQHAYDGDIHFFRDNPISPDDLIFPNNLRKFMGFCNFLMTLAYDTAIRQADYQEDRVSERELKLEARKSWTPRLSKVRALLAPYYVTSVLTRVYNLVTSGEEKPTLRDRTLDLIMR